MKSGQIWLLLLAFVVLLGPVVRAQEVTVFAGGLVPGKVTLFAINYGGGLKFPKMFGPAGLRIDARGYTATGVFSHSVNMFELSGGVMFSF